MEAAQLSEERGVHTLSTDEMTGIQALERVSASQPAQPGQVARDEFEYLRHGTTTLIGNLDVVTGESISPTLGPTRTEKDFVKHIDTTVSADPEGEWRLILDGLNIHWSAGLVEWGNERCALNEPLGEKRQTRSAEKPSHTPRVLVRSVASHSVHLPAQT